MGGPTLKQPGQSGGQGRKDSDSGPKTHESLAMHALRNLAILAERTGDTAGAAELRELIALRERQQNAPAARTGRGPMAGTAEPLEDRLDVTGESDGFVDQVMEGLGILPTGLSPEFLAMSATNEQMVFGVIPGDFSSAAIDYYPADGSHPQPPQSADGRGSGSSQRQLINAKARALFDQVLSGGIPVQTGPLSFEFSQYAIIGLASAYFSWVQAGRPRACESDDMLSRLLGHFDAMDKRPAEEKPSARATFYLTGTDSILNKPDAVVPPEIQALAMWRQSVALRRELMRSLDKPSSDPSVERTILMDVLGSGLEGEANRHPLSAEDRRKMFERLFAGAQEGPATPSRSATFSLRSSDLFPARSPDLFLPGLGFSMDLGLYALLKIARTEFYAALALAEEYSMWDHKSKHPFRDHFARMDELAASLTRPEDKNPYPLAGQYVRRMCANPDTCLPNELIALSTQRLLALPQNRWAEGSIEKDLTRRFGRVVYSCNPSQHAIVHERLAHMERALNLGLLGDLSMEDAVDILGSAELAGDLDAEPVHRNLISIQELDALRTSDPGEYARIIDLFAAYALTDIRRNAGHFGSRHPYSSDVDQMVQIGTESGGVTHFQQARAYVAAMRTRPGGLPGEYERLAIARLKLGSVRACRPKDLPECSATDFALVSLLLTTGYVQWNATGRPTSLDHVNPVLLTHLQGMVQEMAATPTESEPTAPESTKHAINVRQAVWGYLYELSTSVGVPQDLIDLAKEHAKQVAAKPAAGS